MHVSWLKIVLVRNLSIKYVFITKGGAKMHLKKVYVFTLLVLLMMFLAGFALAQDEEAPVESKVNIQGVDVTSDVDEKETGWDPLLKASGNFSLGHNQNMPGNPDGLSMSLGYLINGGMDYLNDTREHEWMNTLMWQLGYAQTPAIEKFVKNMDMIDLKSSYLYHIPSISWMGPFASVRIKTSMLPSYAIYAEDKNILRLRVAEDYTVAPDGSIADGDFNPIGIANPRVETVTAGNEIDLTSAFAPTTLRQGGGWFFIPMDKKEIKIDARVGLGVWETFTRDGYSVKDNEDTETVLELQQMQDYVQLGPEASLALNGVLEKMVTYFFGALAMYPAWHNADTDLEGIELTNVEFDFLLGIALWEYVSLDYAFKAYYQPLLVEDWQLQNGLLLSVNFNLVD